MLAVDGLRRAFGGVRAVDEVGFAVGQGEIVGLIGPNGAGKTTVFNLVAGSLRPDAGSIRFRGEEVAGARPHEVARRGIGRSFQIPRIFGRLTVMENMLLGAEHRGDTRLYRMMLAAGAVRSRERQQAGEAMNGLRRVGIDHLAQQPASVLSGGQRKLLGFARALMGHPDLMLLDEPAAGVNPTLAAEIARYLAGLRDEGVTLLIVEHNLGFLDRIADRVLVMAEGRLLAQGTLAEVRQNHDVLDAYLGKSAGAARRRAAPSIDTAHHPRREDP
jgi:branched-chain amino acid transport system ATP-binding protein